MKETHTGLSDNKPNLKDSPLINLSGHTFRRASRWLCGAAAFLATASSCSRDLSSDYEQESSSVPVATATIAGEITGPAKRKFVDQDRSHKDYDLKDVRVVAKNTGVNFTFSMSDWKRSGGNLLRYLKDMKIEFTQPGKYILSVTDTAKPIVNRLIEVNPGDKETLINVQYLCINPNNAHSAMFEPGDMRLQISYLGEQGQVAADTIFFVSNIPKSMQVGNIQTIKAVPALPSAPP